MGFFDFMTEDVAIDLGTANTLIIHNGKVVIDSPSIVARDRSTGKIIAIDLNENRLAMAKSFGATHLIKATKEDRDLIKAHEEVKQWTGGRGADYAFECTGVPALGAAPLRMVRNAGVAIQVSGIEEELTIDMNLFEWDKTNVGFYEVTI